MKPDSRQHRLDPLQALLHLRDARQGSLRRRDRQPRSEDETGQQPQKGVGNLSQKGRGSASSGLLASADCLQIEGGQSDPNLSASAPSRSKPIACHVLPLPSTHLAVSQPVHVLLLGAAPRHAPQHLLVLVFGHPPPRHLSQQQIALLGAQVPVREAPGGRQKGYALESRLPYPIFLASRPQSMILGHMRHTP